MAHPDDVPGAPRPSPVQSVDRAITILEVLADQGETGVTDIAQQLGVHKSTAFRLVGALESRGLVEQRDDRGGYRLAMGLLRLAGAAALTMDVTRACRPACEALAHEHGETVNVAVPDGAEVLNLDQVRGSSAVVSQNWAGRRTPLHATSSGKVLMAFLPAVRAAGLRLALRRSSPHTLLRADLLADLEDVVARGSAVSVEELEPGLNAVAAPVRDHEGDVVAAISLSGPAYRLTPERLQALRADVVAAADRASTAMGWSPGAPDEAPAS